MGGQAARHGPPTWPQILRLAQESRGPHAVGDEDVVPAVGTLSYTWARRGQPAYGPDIGKRKGYKVFGLIEYFTDASGIKGRRATQTRTAYIAFHKGVWSRPRNRSF